jgi:hypothetical protein
MKGYTIIKAKISPVLPFGSELVAYAATGMEQLCGFSLFAAEAAEIQRWRTKCHIENGESRIEYLGLSGPKTIGKWLGSRIFATVALCQTVVYS